MSSSSSSNPSCISNSISSPNSSASINHSTLTYRQKYKLWTESFKAKLKVLEERYDESLSLDLDEKQRIELKRKNAMVRDRLGELSCYWVNENLFLTTIESFKPTTPEEVESLEKTVFRRLRRVTNGKNFLSKMEEIEDAKKRLPDEDLKIRGKYSHAYYEARHDPAQYSPAEIASVRAPFVAVDKEYDETMKQLARLEQVLEPNEKKAKEEWERSEKEEQEAAEKEFLELLADPEKLKENALRIKYYDCERMYGETKNVLDESQGLLWAAERYATQHVQCF